LRDEPQLQRSNPCSKGILVSISLSDGSLADFRNQSQSAASDFLKQSKNCTVVIMHILSVESISSNIRKLIWE
jgi:hypothetical protein